MRGFEYTVTDIGADYILDLIQDGGERPTLDIVIGDGDAEPEDLRAITSVQSPFTANIEVISFEREMSTLNGEPTPVIVIRVRIDGEALTESRFVREIGVVLNNDILFGYGYIRGGDINNMLIPDGVVSPIHEFDIVLSITTEIADKLEVSISDGGALFTHERLTPLHDTVHGLRYFDDRLQLEDGDNWLDVGGGDTTTRITPERVDELWLEAGGTIGDGYVPTTPPEHMSVWTDSTGFQWLVGWVMGRYMMLVARFTIQDDRIPGAGGFNNFVAWTNDGTTVGTSTNALRTRLGNWWGLETEVSQMLRDSAVHASIPHRDFLSSAYTDSAVGATSLSFLSSPIQTTSVAINPLFILSEAEVFINLGRINNAMRVVPSVSATGVISSGGTTYQLRSRGNVNNPNLVPAVGADGGWSFSSPFTTALTGGAACLPAVWVDWTKLPQNYTPAIQVLREDNAMQIQSLSNELEAQKVVTDKLTIFTNFISQNVLTEEERIAFPEFMAQELAKQESEVVEDDIG